jgi:hypothetical protein
LNKDTLDSQPLSQNSLADPSPDYDDFLIAFHHLMGAVKELRRMKGLRVQEPLFLIYSLEK